MKRLSKLQLDLILISKRHTKCLYLLADRRIRHFHCNCTEDEYNSYVKKANEIIGKKGLVKMDIDINNIVSLMKENFKGEPPSDDRLQQYMTQCVVTKKEFDYIFKDNKSEYNSLTERVALFSAIDLNYGEIRIMISIDPDTDVLINPSLYIYENESGEVLEVKSIIVN